jgi:hypothetical protein
LDGAESAAVAPATPEIFICYRREDAGHAGRLHADLARALGDDAVFFDIHGIPGGEDFRDYLRRRVSECRILLVVIGSGWSAAALHEPGDYVRQEIATALESGKRVVPVLVEGSAPPAESDLPEALKSLAFRNAFELSDRHWDADVEELVALLRKSLGRRRIGWWIVAAAAVLAAAIIAAVAMWLPREPPSAGKSAATTTGVPRSPRKRPTVLHSVVRKPGGIVAVLTTTRGAVLNVQLRGGAARAATVWFVLSEPAPGRRQLSKDELIAGVPLTLRSGSSELRMYVPRYAIGNATLSAILTLDNVTREYEIAPIPSSEVDQYTWRFVVP